MSSYCAGQVSSEQADPLTLKQAIPKHPGYVHNSAAYLVRLGRLALAAYSPRMCLVSVMSLAGDFITVLVC